MGGGAGVSNSLALSSQLITEGVGMLLKETLHDDTDYCGFSEAKGTPPFWKGHGWVGRTYLMFINFLSSRYFLIISVITI